jgi:hypothetical protein
MSQMVSISRSHLENLIAKSEALENFAASMAIGHPKFDVYLEKRKPFLQQLYTIKYALQYGCTPSIVSAPSSDN